LDLILTTTGSSGAQLGEVQAHQTRQFNLNMLEFFKKNWISFISPWAVQEHELGKFRHTKRGSSPRNKLEFLFKSEFIFTTTGSSGARVEEVQAHQTRQFTLNML
jgi:hypothetical protein